MVVACMAILSLKAQECDVCYQPTERVTEASQTFYSPYMPQIGPPKSSSQRGQWYNPMRYVKVVITTYYWDGTDWKFGHTSPGGDHADCYNVEGCVG